MDPPAPQLRIFPDRAAASAAAAALLAEEVRAANARGRRAVLGLATGKTPIDVYRELVERHRRDRAAKSSWDVETFNLDEYHPIAHDHPVSFHAFMRAHLFDAIGLAPARRHLPDGTTPNADVPAAAAAYEAAIVAAGGIDVQLLGIGANGHIGFNEPGSARDSRTRRVALAESTRARVAAEFGGIDRVPTHAITMGIATILDARKIVLLAFGAEKARALRAALAPPPRPELPASFLQEHRDVVVIADEAAAARAR